MTLVTDCHRTRKSTTSLTLNFGNQIVQPLESAKYLGIFVDEHLSSKPHIIFLEKKCSVSSNVATSERLIGSIGYYVNLESSSIGCSTQPVGRIGMGPFDTYVTMASTTGRWSGGRPPLRWLET